MKPTVRPGMHSFDHLGKFDGDRKTLRHRGRQNDKREVQNQIDENDIAASGIICKAWDHCTHPEFCEEKCQDEDLVDSGQT